MPPFRQAAGAIAGWLLISLCVLVGGTQLSHLTRRIVHWNRMRERVPGFGQADVVYFYEPSCSACRLASPGMAALRRRYPSYRIAQVNTLTTEGIALQAEYSRAYRVP